MVVQSPELVVDGLQMMTDELGVPLAAIARKMHIQPQLLDDLLGRLPGERSAEVVNLFSRP